MTNVVIYSSNHCPYCTRAKDLLQRKQLNYKEIRVDQDENQMAKMVELSGRRTVPQIFINDKPIGGFDDLWALEQQGKLDLLLNGEQ